MSGHQTATVGDTVYFWFAANDTSGSGGDGATPLFDVREAGAAAGAAPLLSGTPTLLTHANYPAGCHEVAVAATVGNGFAADDTFAVFCTLAIDSQNPSGFVGSCTLTPLAKQADLTSVKTKTDFLPSATAGAAGGVLIAGTNAATIFDEGVTISNAGGDALALSSGGGNGNGLTATGNGSGSGIEAGGGTVGIGLDCLGGPTSGSGFRAFSSSGNGITATGSVAGHGINATAAGSGDDINADITGDITGNLSGSAGSVTGAVGSVTGNVGGTVNGLTVTALADLFDTDSGTNYASAVAGSVVKEIADNAGGSALTEAGIADAVWDEAQAGHVAAGSFGVIASEIAGIETQIGTAGDGLTGIPWNAAWDAEVQSEVNDGLVALGLDHLVGASVTGTDITDDSIIAKMVSGSATADWDDFVNTTDSLQAARDHIGDGTNLSEAGGTGDHLTAINLPNQTMDIVGDITGNLSGSIGSVTGAVGSVTGAVGSVTGSVGSLVGHTVQTGDSFARLGAPAGASIAADLAALNDVSVADILTTQMTESYAADGAAPTIAQALMLIQQSLGEFAISGTTLTVKKVDGSTTAATFTLDDATSPTSTTRAT